MARGVSRRPETIYEDRIDFDRIREDQDQRHAKTLNDLRAILFDMQQRTLAWVRDNLEKRKLKTAVAKFELPLKPKYRAVLRKRITGAARRGAADVAGELDLAPPRFKVAELSRVRARADALYEDHMNRLEGDLKRVWSKAMFGKVDGAQLAYETRRVFADFAGWLPPEVP